jgi:DNA-binding HxlR family transcriptional regulator
MNNGTNMNVKTKKRYQGRSCPAGTAFVPFVKVIRSLVGKWKLEILWILVQRKHRFGELRAAIPGITQHMLTVQLRELEADGLVKRIAYAEIPPRVEYEVTQDAMDLSPVFEAFLVWSQQHDHPSPEGVRRPTRERLEHNGS